MNKIPFIDIVIADRKIGKMALTPEGLCAFEYDVDYLKTGVSLSPFYLPLKSGLFTAKRDPFAGGFGLFDDSLPDGWGMLLLDRYLNEKGVNPDKLTLLQRLSLIGSRGRGALEYYPDHSLVEEQAFIDFNKLASEADKILTSNYTGESLETLYQYGGSSGGARPKVFVEIDGKEWLLKFKSSSDPDNVGYVEYQYSLLAKECGIDMPETRLMEGKYFAVERFDRSVEGRIHTISAAGLLNADYRIPSLDYITLLKACHILTKDMEQVYALFRQMVFNVVISNRDDHAKNFSFQLKGKDWFLSPAYDILPSRGFNGFHSTTINNKVEATFKDIMAVASELGLSMKRSKSIYDEIVDKCAVI